MSSGQNYESKLKPLSQTHVAGTHTSQESTSNMDEDSDSDSDDTDDADDEVSDESDGDSELSFDGVHESTTTTTSASTSGNVDTHTSTASSSSHDLPMPHPIPPHREYPMVLCGDFNTLLETECFESDTGYTPSSLIELMRTGQVPVYRRLLYMPVICDGYCYTYILLQLFLMLCSYNLMLWIYTSCPRTIPSTQTYGPTARRAPTATLD